MSICRAVIPYQFWRKSFETFELHSSQNLVYYATSPVCRLVDFGKYRYELGKQGKEGRK